TAEPLGSSVRPNNFAVLKVNQTAIEEPEPYAALLSVRKDSPRYFLRELRTWNVLRTIIGGPTEDASLIVEKPNLPMAVSGNGRHVSRNAWDPNKSITF